MIKVSYTPQAALPGHRLVYTWNGRVLTVQHIQEVMDPEAQEPASEVIAEEEFDFSVLNPRDKAAEITTEVLQFPPVSTAEVDENGDLHVTLLHWYQLGEPEEREEEVFDG